MHSPATQAFDSVVRLSRALVQRDRVVLDGRPLAPSTIDQHLGATRAVAGECAEGVLLDEPTPPRRSVASGLTSGLVVRRRTLARRSR